MNNLSLAEMANNADYAAMSYGELLNTKIAYTYVLGIKINPLLKAKRLDEMAKFTKIYMTWMNAYDATRSEIMSLLEKEGMTDNHMYSSPAYKEDQTSEVVPCNDEKDNQVSEETVLALPEHTNTTDNVDESVSEEADPETESKDDEAVGENPTVSSPEEETPVTDSGQNEEVENPVEENPADEEDKPGTEEPVAEDSTSQETTEQTLAEKALAKAKTRPLPDNIDATAPYFVNYYFDLNDKGDIINDGKYGRNLDRKDLESFRAASEIYMKVFMKQEVMMSTDDYLVYKDWTHSLVVSLYHFPEQEKEGVGVSYSNQIPYDTACDLHKTIRRIEKAIEKAKKYTKSIGSSSSPFYDRYTFYDNNATVTMNKEPLRFIEDIDTLAEIKSAVKIYAQFYKEGSVVIADDNSIAAKLGSTIYLLVFNFPNQNQVTAPEKKKRRTRKAKKSAPVTKDDTVTKEPEEETTPSPSQSVRDLILKAVEMTKTLPVSSGTNINSPYFVQNCYCITNNGEIILTGKPFGSNVDGEGLDKYRKIHRKHAKTMKASATVSTDDYTAFIWNEGKNLTVFYYNTQDKKEAA